MVEREKEYWTISFTLKTILVLSLFCYDLNKIIDLFRRLKLEVIRIILLKKILYNFHIGMKWLCRL